MNWDIVLYAASAPPPPAAQAGAAWGLLSMGTTEEVRRHVRLASPQVDSSDPAYGTVDGPGYLVEFNLGSDEPVDSLLVHISGTTQASRFVQDFVEETGWYAFDTRVGEWLHHLPDPSMADEWTETVAKVTAQGRRANWLDALWDSFDRWVKSRL